MVNQGSDIGRNYRELMGLTRRSSGRASGQPIPVDCLVHHTMTSLIASSSLLCRNYHFDYHAIIVRYLCFYATSFDFG